MPTPTYLCLLLSSKAFNQMYECWTASIRMLMFVLLLLAPPAWAIESYLENYGNCKPLPNELAWIKPSKFILGKGILHFGDIAMMEPVARKLKNDQCITALVFGNSVSCE